MPVTVNTPAEPCSVACDVFEIVELSTLALQSPRLTGPLGGSTAVTAPALPQQSIALRSTRLSHGMLVARGFGSKILAKP